MTIHLTHRARRDRRGHRAAGAAVLMALFVVTLATLIVSGLFWNQFVLVRTIENQELISQSRLLLRGALDWARAILREDARTTTVDALTEPWAQGLQETRLDQLGETSALAARASMAGSIEDAQSRFNLRNLINAQYEIDPIELAALRKLMQLQQIPEAVADLIALRMQESLTPTPLDQGTSSAGQSASSGNAAATPIPLVYPGDLVGIPGIDPDIARRLAPLIVVLDAPTPVNVNTVAETPEVIAARVPAMLLSDAKTLLNRRQGYFRDLGDLTNVVNAIRPGLTINSTQLDVQSRYFFVRGQVRLDRAVTRMEALVRRDPAAGGRVTVLWQREL